MLAIVFWLMFRSLQYDDRSHLRSGFVPLLELHAPQDLTTLIDIIDWSSHLSLSMCSHVALRFLSPLDEENLTRQYTQRRSLARTSFRSNSGIPQFFMIGSSSTVAFAFAVLPLSCVTLTLLERTPLQPH